ncbi:hypothetical protein [Aquisphaera insulae]|uniref:hypothetical protein n=1 Tax=Aquisphaera insulae TaxID=2712864 RepID=UPI0013EB59AF|nr:hypothetical protein [Aquisphaera insulae]
MPETQDYPSASLGLATGLFMIALFLGLREWYERRAREEDRSQEDRAHFARQDLRRGLGIGLVASVAVLVVVGAILEWTPHRRPSVLFPIVWIVIMGLMVSLLVLALVDLAATRDYARRHRRRIVHESIDSIRREARRKREDAHDDDKSDPL